MSEYKLEPVSVVGSLDEPVFHGIRAIEVLWDNKRSLTWRTAGPDPELEALEPLAQIVLTEEARLGCRPPAIIDFAIDRTPVPPRQAQRSVRWHIDSGGNEAAHYAVADTLPTEFLATDTTSKKADRHARRALKGQLQDSELEAKGLVIVRSGPFEVVRFDQHIHRSPVNVSYKTVARSWIRASILKRAA